MSPGRGVEIRWIIVCMHPLKGSFPISTRGMDLFVLGFSCHFSSFSRRSVPGSAEQDAGGAQGGGGSRQIPERRASQA